MTAKELESLLIDQALDELAPEASALLDSYLEHFPERRAEAERLREALSLTEGAVLQKALVHEKEASPPAGGAWGFFSQARPRAHALGRAAAVLLLLGMGAGAGYFFGKGDRPPAGGPALIRQESQESQESPSPWARYRLDADGGLALVSVEEGKS